MREKWRLLCTGWCALDAESCGHLRRSGNWCPKPLDFLCAVAYSYLMQTTNPDAMWKLEYASRLTAKETMHANRKLALVLGDNGRHWVMTLADAARLERAGYTVEYR